MERGNRWTEGEHRIGESKENRRMEMKGKVKGREIYSKYKKQREQMSGKKKKVN